MKCAIYAISKNESKHVKRFMESCKGFPVFIIDTGSEDDTVDLFNSFGAYVEQKKYDEFSFSQAKNDALDLIPEEFDTFINLDIDEVVSDNLKFELSEANKDDHKSAMIRCKFHDTRYGTRYNCQRIHVGRLIRWRNIVHEELFGSGRVLYCDKIIITHHPDNEKQRNYLPLIQKELKRNPRNPRMLQYLADEYQKIGRNDDAVSALIIADDSFFKSSLKGTEHAYVNIRIGKLLNKIEYHLTATIICPEWKEVWYELAWAYIRQSDIENNKIKAIYALLRGLECNQQYELSYSNSYCWNEHYYFFLADLYRDIGEKELAFDTFKIAYKLFPGSEAASRLAEML